MSALVQIIEREYRVRKQMIPTRRLVVVIVTVSVLLASAVVLGGLIPFVPDSGQTPQLVAGPFNEPRDPIYIVGNENFTEENGVTRGSGTSEDPYVIEGWYAAVSIVDTTAHVVIRNMLMMGVLENLWYAGGLYLDNVTNCIVEYCHKIPAPVEDFTRVQAIQCHNVTFRGNWIQGFVFLVDSSDILFESSLFGGYKLYLNSAHDVLVRNNTFIDPSTFSDPGYGITAWDSDGIEIEGNYIIDDLVNSRSGTVSLERVTNATVHGNSFLYTDQQAEDDLGPENRWNASYPEGGNYWSDYAGSDSFSGPDQDLPGSDGIGDTPYVIDGDSSDYYPLMGPLNTPPFVWLEVFPHWGDLTTAFVFNASSSVDLQDDLSALEVRWDWEGDGTWDTDWSTTKSALHTYSLPGYHEALVEVRDSGGLTSTASFGVTVEGVIPEFGGAIVPVTVLLTVAIVMFLRRARRSDG